MTAGWKVCESEAVRSYGDRPLARPRARRTIRRTHPDDLADRPGRAGSRGPHGEGPGAVVLWPAADVDAVSAGARAGGHEPGHGGPADGSAQSRRISAGVRGHRRPA